MFEPKINTLDIHSVEDVWKRLDEVCDNEKNFTDEELSKKLSEIYDYCNGGESGKDFYFISHMRSDILCENRVKKYCKKHKIKLEEYNGVIPYRKFIISMNTEKQFKREYKWKHMFGMIRTKLNTFWK